MIKLRTLAVATLPALLNVKPFSGQEAFAFISPIKKVTPRLSSNTPLRLPIGILDTQSKPLGLADNIDDWLVEIEFTDEDECVPQVDVDVDSFVNSLETLLENDSAGQLAESFQRDHHLLLPIDESQKQRLALARESASVTDLSVQISDQNATQAILKVVQAICKAPELSLVDVDIDIRLTRNVLDKDIGRQTIHKDPDEQLVRMLLVLRGPQTEIVMPEDAKKYLAQIPGTDDFDGDIPEEAIRNLDGQLLVFGSQALPDYFSGVRSDFDALKHCGPAQKAGERYLMQVSVTMKNS